MDQAAAESNDSNGHGYDGSDHVSVTSCMPNTVPAMSLI